MAPKFPLYTVVFFFLCGMLFAPLLENNLLPYSLLVVVLGLSLLKKFRPFAFVIFLPLGAIHQQQYYELPPNHYLQYTSSKKEKTLVVSLTEALRSNDYQYRFYGQVIQVADEATTGKILLGIDKGERATPSIGDLILTQKSTEPLISKNNPGGFDYSNYLSNIKIYDQLRLKKQDFVWVKNPEISKTNPIRSQHIILEKKLDKSPLTLASKNILKALFLGKRTALDRELIDAYARAGVIHVLAISGLHVGIIMLFLGFVLSPLQWLPKGKWIHTSSILLLLWGFAFFTGGSPSVVRAVTMFSAFAVAKYSRRIHSTFHLLVVSFFLLLVVYPPFVYQVGFQMNYLAVLGIITIHPLIQKCWSPKLLILKKFWQLTTVCLAAQIAVAPLSIYYFHQFPGLFLLSNWIILPFFGMFLIFGMGLLLLIAFDTEILPLFEGFDRIIDLMNQAIFWVARQEAFLFQNIPLSIPVLLGIYLLMFLIYKAVQSRNPKYFFWGIATVAFLQISVFYEDWKSSKIDRLWLLYQHQKTIIAHHHGGRLSIYSPQKIPLDLSVLRDFQIRYPVDTLLFKSFKNTFVAREFGLLVLDDRGIYKIDDWRPSHLLICSNPPLNMDRVLTALQPQVVLADGTNQPWHVERWKKSCEKKGIPFISLRETGAYKINL